MYLINPKKIVSRISEMGKDLSRSAQVRLNQRMVAFRTHLHQGLGRHK
jgi:hypothetical protein